MSGPGPLPAVETHGLAKRYGPAAALAPLSVVIRPGESVLLAGPNGAGKSTLLRLLATLVRPTSGSLALWGESVGGGAASPAQRRRIGFLSHQTFLYDYLTGFENLEFYARLYGLADPAAAARAALASVGLSRRADDRVGGYSRGLQQRLAIARTLLHAPDLVLLDEPFTGLDRDSCHALEERLARDARPGRTLVVATHDLEPGLRLSGRLLLLRDGRLEVDAPTAGMDAARLERLLHAPSAIAPGVAVRP